MKSLSALSGQETRKEKYNKSPFIIYLSSLFSGRCTDVIIAYQLKACFCVVLIDVSYCLPHAPVLLLAKTGGRLEALRGFITCVTKNVLHWSCSLFFPEAYACSRHSALS